MAITVTMIEEKEFKTKVRGYDPVEVDEFLDAICDEMIEMQGTMQTLREQLKQKSEQVSSSYAPLPVSPLPQNIPAPAPVKSESLPQDIIAAQKLLEKTQQSCSEILTDAKKRAENLLKEAEDQLPDPELLDLQSEKDGLMEEIERLKEEAAGFRKRFQSMLQDQNEILQADLF